MLDLKDKWVWDFWFYMEGAEQHIFFLQAPKSLGDERYRHFNASIGHAKSMDLINWNVLPDVLGPGAAGAWDDQATWTGCTFKNGEIYYLFYTGVNKKEQGLVQRIGVATSKDLIHWEKHEGNPIIEADQRWYEILDLNAWHDQAWRDPWVFAYKGQFHAYITARVNYGEADGRGVIAHAVSNDLLNWEVQPPITEPGNFGQLEVPQLIEVDSIPYLLFSTDRFTHSKTLLDRTKNPPVTGFACYQGATLLGPFTHTDDPWLFCSEEGSLYSGKFIDASASGWRLMAFENYSINSEFIGRISNPFLVKKFKTLAVS